MDKTPKELGFRMPAEYEKQTAIWLTWPKDPKTWPDRVKIVQDIYIQIIDVVSSFQIVNLLLDDEKQLQVVLKKLQEAIVNLSNVKFHIIKTVDAWIRDYGPTFVISEDSLGMINWTYNAWGNKYEELKKDNSVPLKIFEEMNYLKIFDPKIVLEGGSIEVDGQGTVIVTEQCLLNKNRNPNLSKAQIEKNLCDFLNVKKVIWLKSGIVGDDTDGHVDDITRFVLHKTVVTCVEKNQNDKNHKVLAENLKILKSSTDANSKSFDIIELPMPEMIYANKKPLPASYANFLITNEAVLVPIFNQKNDERALKILKEIFTNRQVLGFNCEDVVWGLGAIHCLSQQQP
ncbi:MAG: agmatine deiminase family protein, partial [Parachlamydiales bacterium]|nr:agmatine deiminase family protein [Parachlamydiales bacterium]